MQVLSTKKLRVFLAHFTEWALWSYVTGLCIVFFLSDPYFYIPLTFIAGLFFACVFSAICFEFFEISPVEWLWGCKLNLAKDSKSKFLSYFMQRLYLNDLEFVDYKCSGMKIFIGLLWLLAIIGIYFL